MTESTTYAWDDRELARLELQAAHTWQLVGPLLSAATRLDGAHVVDLGCGPGRVAARIATAVGPTGTVVGVDHDAGLLARAAATPVAEHAAHCRWIAADAADVPLAEGQADVVLAHMLLQHVPDPAAVVAQAARLLRPGGLLVLVDVDDAFIDAHPRDASLDELLATSAATQAARGGDRHIGRRLGALARAAGLTDVQARVNLFTSPPLPIEVVFEAAIGFRHHLVPPELAAAAQATVARLRAGLDDPTAWVQAGVFAVTARRP